MGFLDTYRIKKALTVVLSSQDAASAETMQAVTTLKRCAQVAIPKLIDALGGVQAPQVITGLLASCVHSETLALFAEGLASANPRVVAGVTEALMQATSYDPNHLLGWFADRRIVKATLSKILAVHKAHLQAEAILRCLHSVRADERPLLLGLLRQVVTVEAVPALTSRLSQSDDALRLALVRLLMPFRTPEVQQALLEVCTDPHAPIREAALEGLARLPFPLDVAPLCQMLRDPVPEVRRQASLLLAQQGDPQTVPSLLDVAQDPTPEIQQGAVELLATLGTTPSIQAAVSAAPDQLAMQDLLMRLLEAPQSRVRQLALDGLAQLHEPLDVTALCRLLWDPDRAVRQQVVTLLAQGQTPQTVPMLLDALQDEATEVRQGAVTILNALGDATFLKALLQGLHGKEWWVILRVMDALGHHGGAPIIEAALHLSLEDHGELRQHAIEILKRTADPQVLARLTALLEAEDDPSHQLRAVEVISAMGEKQLVPTLLQLTSTPDQALYLAVLQALTTLGDVRALPAFLTALQSGIYDEQLVALPALGSLTDAAHAEAVLQAVMTVRSASDADLKTLANNTASTLIRRFGIRAVGQSTSMELHLPRTASQSVLYEAASESPMRSVVTPSPPEEAHETTSLLGAPEAEPILDATALSPGMILAGRYRVLRQIGQGGFGTVMLVEDTMVREQLVLKFLHAQMASDKRMIKRFIRELLYARRVTHENVIRIHDFLSISQSYAISMEYFPSRNLGMELIEQAPMPIQRALRIIWHICRGMAAAHQAKIIHRDLKPQNVLINDTGVVKIVDFGLAAAASETVTRLTKTGALLGTPLYMAPEQVQNRQLDVRTDIYSLGVMMYEMCTGRPPYRGANPMAILYQHVEGKAEPPQMANPDLDPSLGAVIQQAMAVDPAQRFPNMEALGKSLIPFLKHTTRLKPVEQA